MWKYVRQGGLASVLTLAAVSPSVAQPTLADAKEDPAIKQAIADAEEARAMALAALRKAEETLARLRPRSDKPNTANTSALILNEHKFAAVVDRPSDPPMPACDAPGPDGIANYMLRGAKRETGVSRSELAETNIGTNAFVYHCLGLVRARDYADTSNLSVQLASQFGSEQIEAGLSVTKRAVADFTAGEMEWMRPSYLRLSAGGFARTKDGKTVIYDYVDDARFSSGVGISLGIEKGWSRPAKRADLVTTINTGIAKARSDCVATSLVSDPLKTAAGTAPSLASDPLASCTGDELVRWMSHKDRRTGYWSSIAAPVWGQKADPEVFVGARFRHIWAKESYRPVKDPLTGDWLPGSELRLPAEIKKDPRLFTATFYAGRNYWPKFFGLENSIGFTTSLTYRRELIYARGTADQTVCEPVTGKTIQTCNKYNLAAPDLTTGFVPGLALNLKLGRFWYFPELAIAPRITYALDTDQEGIELPFFFLTDKDGKANSGLKLNCRGRGETSAGYKIKETCTLSLFAGTSFSLSAAP